MRGARSDSEEGRDVWYRFLRPPIFEDPEMNASARMFHWVALLTAYVVTALLLILGISQPELFGRALKSIVIVDVMVIGTVIINRLGHPRVASWVYLAVAITLITYSAVSAGGIRSPGVHAWFIYVMLAGLLLGHRAGVLVATVCVVAGLGLVLAERQGIIASRGVEFDPYARWLLLSMYVGIALLTLRAATARVEEALQRVMSELRDRRAAEYRLTRALDVGRIGTFDWDLQTDAFLADERALRITGLLEGPDGKVVLSEWIDRVDPDDRSMVLTQLQAFRSGSSEGRLNYRFRSPSGELRYHEVAASAIKDHGDTPPSVLGMIMDVTGRQRAAQERERLVQDLSKRVGELRLLHDAARLLQEASGIDQPLLTELAHRITSAWLHADDASARITYRDIVVTTPGWSDTEWRQAASFHTSDGSSGGVEVCYRREHTFHEEGPFLVEERALLNSLAEMLRAHAERWEVEQQRKSLESQLRQAQRLDALGTLAGGIAHDFNNILTAIGGHAELALHDVSTDDPTADSIREILRAHGRARDLVRRILLFSRREESVTRDLISLTPVINEAVELLRASLPSNVQIRVDMDEDLPNVLADATQIHQIVMNLGTNAGYSMKAKGGSLRLALENVAANGVEGAFFANLEPGPIVRLTVQDTGTGMSPAVLDRLYEPFFTTKGHEGTGLGLSVVHGIVREHGGTIEVSSEPGVGTEFRVYLPAGRGTLSLSPYDEELLRGRGQHIMYVDDEPSLALVMSKTLRYLGYRCTYFTDAEAALQEFRTTPDAFDAVITDLQMPTIIGVDLIKALRAIRPDLPVAVVSGYITAREANADVRGLTWLSKPASISEISVLVHELVADEPNLRRTPTRL